MTYTEMLPSSVLHSVLFDTLENQKISFAAGVVVANRPRPCKGIHINAREFGLAMNLCIGYTIF